jgi:hypothetical protein
MASYTVNVAKHATLTPDTVDNITFTAPASFILLTNRTTSGASIYFTYGDPTKGVTDPAVAGNDSYHLGIGQTLSIPGDGSAPLVKAISSQAQAYSVQVI